MKKLLLSLSMAFISITGFSQDEVVNIPDARFKLYLIGNRKINTNEDREISVAEAEAFKGGIFCSRLQISDLTGTLSL